MHFCPSHLTLPPASQSCCAFIFISSLPSLHFEKNSWAGLSICHGGLQPPHTPPPSTSLALSWTSACVCQNTDSASLCSESIRSHLYHKQSPRFILPITSEHLLFKFQIIFLGVNSVPAILGVYSLHLQLNHLICMLVDLYVHTLAHTQMCIRIHAHAHGDTRMSCPHHHRHKHRVGLSIISLYITLATKSLR